MGTLKVFLLARLNLDISKHVEVVLIQELTVVLGLVDEIISGRWGGDQCRGTSRHVSHCAQWPTGGRHYFVIGYEFSRKMFLIKFYFAWSWRQYRRPFIFSKVRTQPIDWTHKLWKMTFWHPVQAHCAVLLPTLDTKYWDSNSVLTPLTVYSVLCSV